MDKFVSYSKATQFDDWYQHIITECKLIRYHDVSGCYVLLPNSYNIWEAIQNKLDTNFKLLGVKNTYFPMFVSYDCLQKEKEHLKDFAPEVAWVTGYGDIENKGKLTEGRNGNYSELTNPVAIRPTSETIMYKHFPDIISTYNDLPLQYNQWCNVVRWEFKNPTPFIRSREFLWNEGHSAFETEKESDQEVLDIISLYQDTYEQLLCVPVIRGLKTEKEKFAGGSYTYTLEGFIPESGRGIQCCTAHSLGQNFSKMFGIEFQDKNGETKFVWQTSWGFTTRSIGVMLMTHGDDKGLILPPQVAHIQVVIIPIFKKKNKELLLKYTDKISKMFASTNVKIHIDTRNKHNIGWKYNYWETNGIPLRFEIGQKEMESDCVK